MEILNRLRRWSWDEIYLALNHETGQGEAFEIDHTLVSDPLSSGADSAPRGEQAWDYRFTAEDGGHLYVQDLGDRYAAFLEEDGPRFSGPLVLVGESREFNPALAAAWGGFLVFLGGLWAVLEATFHRVG